jgi:hypothetical protein
VLLTLNALQGRASHRTLAWGLLPWPTPFRTWDHARKAKATCPPCGKVINF